MVPWGRALARKAAHMGAYQSNSETRVRNCWKQRCTSSLKSPPVGAVNGQSYEDHIFFKKMCTFKGRRGRSSDDNVKVSEVVLVRCGRNTGRSVTDEPLGLLDDSLGK